MGDIFAVSETDRLNKTDFRELCMDIACQSTVPSIENAIDHIITLVQISESEKLDDHVQETIRFNNICENILLPSATEISKIINDALKSSPRDRHVVLAIVNLIDIIKRQNSRKS